MGGLAECTWTSPVKVPQEFFHSPSKTPVKARPSLLFNLVSEGAQPQISDLNSIRYPTLSKGPYQNKAYVSRGGS